MQQWISQSVKKYPLYAQSIDNAHQNPWQRLLKNRERKVSLYSDTIIIEQPLSSVKILWRSSVQAGNRKTAQQNRELEQIFQGCFFWSQPRVHAKRKGRPGDCYGENEKRRVELIEAIINGSVTNGKHFNLARGVLISRMRKWSIRWAWKFLKILNGNQTKIGKL